MFIFQSETDALKKKKGLLQFTATDALELLTDVIYMFMFSQRNTFMVAEDDNDDNVPTKLHFTKRLQCYLRDGVSKGHISEADVSKDSFRNWHLVFICSVGPFVRYFGPD